MKFDKKSTKNLLSLIFFFEKTNIQIEKHEKNTKNNNNYNNKLFLRQATSVSIKGEARHQNPSDEVPYQKMYL